MMIFDLTELEIRQAFSDLYNTRSVFSLSLGSAMTTLGSRITSVIKYFPSTFSSLPSDLHSNDIKSSFEFSATARKVVIRQLLMAAVNKCSGDQIPGIPLWNSGGVAISMHPLSPVTASFSSGEHMVPFRSLFQLILTW